MTQTKYNRFWLCALVACFALVVWAVEEIAHAIRRVEYVINDNWN